MSEDNPAEQLQDLASDADIINEGQEQEIKEKYADREVIDQLKPLQTLLINLSKTNQNLNSEVQQLASLKEDLKDEVKSYIELKQKQQEFASEIEETLSQADINIQEFVNYVEEEGNVDSENLKSAFSQFN